MARFFPGITWFNRPETRLAGLVLCLGVALAIPNRYALTVFHEANTAGRVYAAQSYVHYDSWSFEAILCRTGPHHGLVDLSVREGKPLLQKAPGVSWLAVPIYAVAAWLYGGKLPFHQAATLLGLICVWLPGLWLLFFIGRQWMRDYGANWGLLALFGLLAASPFWTYLPMFMDYALASLLLPVAWLCWRSHKRMAWFLGGALAGLAATINYMFIPYGGLLLVLAWLARWRGRESPWSFLGMVLAGGLGPAVALVSYHTIVWGHPLATAYDFMAHDVHKAMHGAAGFSLATLGDSLWHPKLGLLFGVPWVVVGWGGLVVGVRASERRVDAAAGLLMTLATLAFVATWRGANSDDLAFNRHAMPLLPWAAMGLAMALRAAGRLPTLGRKLLLWSLAGMIFVGFFYQFVTAWTYPYHHDALENPLWQVNLPLFANGFLLPQITLSPVMRETQDMLGSGLWWWVLASAALVVIGILAARFGAGKREPVNHFIALPASFAGVVVLLAFWGFATDTSRPAQQVRATEVAVRLAAGDEVTAEEMELFKTVRRATRYYQMATTDVHGSYFTPQDVLWKDEGYPGTNPWCSSPP